MGTTIQPYTRSLNTWTYRCEGDCADKDRRGMGRTFTSRPEAKRRKARHCERYGCAFDQVKIVRMGSDDLFP